MRVKLPPSSVADMVWAAPAAASSAGASVPTGASRLYLGGPGGWGIDEQWERCGNH